jgi:hypothetical protein
MNTTMPETIDLSATVFAKTAVGQAEIQSRTLGLSLLVRRALVLVDGKRSGAELSVFLVGKGDVELVLAELLERGCIEPVGRVGKAAAAVAVPDAVAPPDPAETAAPPDEAVAIPGLPPADSRSAKENEMARNFMINSINSIIGQNMRVTLVTDIFHAKGTDGLRKIYRAWEASMADHGIGARRLPELREKLFKVL